MPQLDKNLIKQRFSKSINTYRNNAFVQEQMAKTLVDKILKQTSGVFGNVLEIGAGDGLLTEKIVGSFNYNCLCANDIVESSVKHVEKISKDIEFMPGDIETVDLEKKYDLIVSNASFQWLDDLPAFFKKISTALNDGGILAFSTFGDENFIELKDVLGISLDYKNKDELTEILEPHFCVLEFECELVKKYFKSPADILRHIKNTGTNAISNKKWLKSDLCEFEKVYGQKYCENGNCVLSYNPYYLVLKKV